MLFYQNKNKIKSFTLIELLIVIVIIGILATALIPRLQGMQDKARYTRVEKDFQDFRMAVFLAHSATNKSLWQITGKFSTYNSCSSGGSFMGIDFQMMPEGHACRTDRISTLRSIEGAAGLNNGALSGLEKDPRGSPYMFDENEGQYGANGCSAIDILRMVGPDGYYQGHNIEKVRDDRELNIAPVGCPGSY